MKYRLRTFDQLESINIVYYTADDNSEKSFIFCYDPESDEHRKIVSYEDGYFIVGDELSETETVIYNFTGAVEHICDKESLMCLIDKIN